MSKHKLKRERALAPRELRYLGNNDARFELRETSNGATITGYAALFAPSQTDMGSYSEVVAPTAFDAALKSGADVRALFNHDPNHVIGRTKAGTLRLSKDSRGLIYQADIPRTTWAQDLAETMRRGDVDQSSYGFFVPEDGEDWEMGQDGIVVRTLRNVNLFDVSPVTFPANPNTISKLRAQFPDGKEHIQERIATLRSTSFTHHRRWRSAAHPLKKPNQWTVWSCPPRPSHTSVTSRTLRRGRCPFISPATRRRLRTTSGFASRHVRAHRGYSGEREGRSVRQGCRRCEGARHRGIP